MLADEVDRHIFPGGLSAVRAKMLDMGSVGEVIDAVKTVLHQLSAAQTALAASDGPLVEAGTAYAAIGQGSHTVELDTAAASLRAAYTAGRDAAAALGAAATVLNAYLSSMEGKPKTKTPVVTPTQPGPAAVTPWRLSPHQADALRRELPPEITPDQRGTGRKTHGQWIGADGQARPVVSGTDAASRGATEWFTAQGLRPVVATHVEIKLAYLLRRKAERTGQQQHATVVINNALCSGSLGCETLLGVMLPLGSTLTVHTPHARRTFTGGHRP